MSSDPPPLSGREPPGTSAGARDPGERSATSADALLAAVAAAPSVDSPWLRMPRVPDRVGAGGKFELRGVLGTGGMGRVFRARDLKLSRDVAIKFLLPSGRLPPADLDALFHREARAVARLRHPNIVQIFELDDSCDPPFIVMEYLRGHSLRAALREREGGSLPAADAVGIALQVAAGLAHAHRQGVYHRDLKPQNILLPEDGPAKILDFGIALMVGAATETNLGGADRRDAPLLPMAGTAPYMAPEQWRGDEVDGRTDIWALGVVLFEALTGRAPFGGGAEVRGEVLSPRPAPSVLQVRPELPARLADVVARALSKEPRERQPTADELADELQDLALSSTVARRRARARRDRRTVAPPFWAPGGDEQTCRLHRAREGAASPRLARLALVILQGRPAGASDDLGALAEPTLASAGVEADVLLVRTARRGARPRDLAAAAGAVRQAIGSLLPHGVSLLVVADEAGAAAFGQVLRDERDRLVQELASEARVECRQLLSFRTRQVVEVTSSAAGHRAGARALAGDDARGEEVMRQARLPWPAFARLEPTGADLPRRVAAAAHLTAYLSPSDLVVAAETVARTFDVDRTVRVRALIGEVEGEPGLRSREDSPSQVEDALVGTQRDVCERLLRLARVRGPVPPRVVVTGDAGVGKSTVLREAVAKLALEYLRDPRGGVLPVMFPLQQETLSREEVAAVMGAEGERGGALFEALTRRWCEWVSQQLLFPGAVEPGWLRHRLAHGPTALVFDGVDEFLSNHQALGVSDFGDMLQWLAATFGGKAPLFLALGVRGSQPGIRALASDSDHLLEVLPLTAAQARAHFPVAEGVLEELRDPGASKLLLTPLILSWLGPRAARLGPARAPQTHAEIIRQAIMAIVERSHLGELRDGDDRRIGAERWLDALTLVGTIFHLTRRGEMSLEAVRAEGRALRVRWAEYARLRRDAALSDVERGFDVLLHEGSCRALFGRTVFVPTGPDRARFTHREWQDFLAARYLAESVGAGLVDELHHIAYTPRIFQIAGELLCASGAQVDEGLVRAILTRARETGSRLMAANFCALLTGSRVPMDGPAIDLLVGSMTDWPAVARYIALNGLGYRGLRDDDPSAPDLRRRLLPLFESCLASDSSAAGGRVMASTGWCYLEAYAKHFGTPAPRGPWPRLDGGDAEREALEMMCALPDGTPHLLPEHRSIQVAFLQAEYIAVGVPHRPISAAHYLYCLCVARRHGAHVADVGRELPTMLDPGSRIAQALAGYEPVPAVGEILRICQRMHGGSAPSSR